MKSEFVIGIFSIIMPIIALFIGAYFQRQRDKLKIEQEAFFVKKRELYLNVIEPIMRMLSTHNDSKVQGKARDEILSLNYKKTCLEFTLYGNDGTVRAFNNLFQLIFEPDTYTNDATILLPFLGKLNLEMRKELGNKKTSFDEFNMLEYLIKDIKSVKREKKTIYLKALKKINEG